MPCHFTKNCLSGRPSRGLGGGALGSASGGRGGGGPTGGWPHFQIKIFCTFPFKAGHWKVKPSLLYQTAHILTYKQLRSRNTELQFPSLVIVLLCRWYLLFGSGSFLQFVWVFLFFIFPRTTPNWIQYLNLVVSPGPHQFSSSTWNTEIARLDKPSSLCNYNSNESLYRKHIPAQGYVLRHLFWFIILTVLIT